MAKQQWKPGNMLYPLPAVMVSVRDNEGKDNIITVAWAGTVCTNPPMVSISVRPERYSYHMIEESGVFVINLTTEEKRHRQIGRIGACRKRYYDFHGKQIRNLIDPLFPRHYRKFDQFENR